jgi:hypothetical protein
MEEKSGKFHLPLRLFLETIMTGDIADTITLEKKRGKPSQDRRLERVAAVEKVEYEDVIFSKHIAEHDEWGKKLQKAHEFCRKFRERQADFAGNIYYSCFFNLEHLVVNPYWGEFN